MASTLAAVSYVVYHASKPAADRVVTTASAGLLVARWQQQPDPSLGPQLAVQISNALRFIITARDAATRVH